MGDSYVNRVESGYMLRPMAINARWGLSQYMQFRDNVELSPALSERVYEDLRKAAQVSFVPSKTGGSIAQIQFKGVMLSEGGMCTPSIDVMCNQILEASRSSTVSGIILNTHSGGGEVIAAQRLSNALEEARELVPIVMYVDGMAASGAYWAGSHCDEIVCGGRTTEVGSNGVVMELDKYWIEMIKEYRIAIYADGSEGKHQGLKDIIEGNFEALRKRELNPLREEFVRVVKNARPNIDEAALTGATFLAPQAKKLGMIDFIGNRQTAVDRVNILSKRRARTSSAKKALKHAR